MVQSIVIRGLKYETKQPVGKREMWIAFFRIFKRNHT